MNVNYAINYKNLCDDIKASGEFALNGKNFKYIRPVKNSPNTIERTNKTKEYIKLITRYNLRRKDG